VCVCVRLCACVCVCLCAFVCVSVFVSVYVCGIKMHKHRIVARGTRSGPCCA
jgi:hypothetical protein